MLEYAIRLENGNYMKYEQTNDYELSIEDTTDVKYAETFSTYDEAKDFAKQINTRKDGDFVILSYEDAISIISINSETNVLDEEYLGVEKKNSKEYIVDVTRGGYMGYNQWEEPIYINTENNEDYDDIFERYVGKKVKLTIEVME